MNDAVTITTFYSFTPIAAPVPLRAPILARMQALGIRGTITLASEGVNATISGAAEAINGLIGELVDMLGIRTDMQRESYFAAQPFKRSKVKVKRELISLGVPTFPAQCVGSYVAPAEWNALIRTRGVITIDTRNQYEYELGHFAGAVNPGTRNFKQMVKWTEAHLPLAERDAPIAMYCTGGIRCEKYSSYLVDLGFKQVYHLRGGILAYLETVPVEQSLWQGNCFVFDERVAVGHGLAPAEAA